MKTIKFFLLSILSTFIAILSLRGAIISLNHITTDFLTTSDKVIYNFSLTFAIQAVILVAIALFFISITVACIQLTHKYYLKGNIERRNRELLKHLADEKYNELVNKLRNAHSTEIKGVYIKEYLYDKTKASWESKTSDMIVEGNKAHEQMEAYMEATKLVSNKDLLNARTGTGKSSNIANTLTKAKKEIILERDTYEPLEFDPITKACQDDLVKKIKTLKQDPISGDFYIK